MRAPRLHPRELQIRSQKTPRRTDGLRQLRPNTPPRQQHQYNKHVINPANKIIPRVRLPHLPGLTHLPAPLSQSFNHPLCHLESWGIAAATVLTGYQETLLTEVCEENRDFGMQ